MSKVVSDQILVLQHANWSHKKARVLIREDNTAAVFTTVGPPTRTFTITSRTSRLLTTQEYGPVRIRVIGSSCSWPLAKCNISTSNLAARWSA